MANDLGVFGGNYSQQHQRRYLRCVDQHGRRWGVNIEIKSNAPTGQWESYFVAPWVPAGKYLKHTMDRPNRVFVDYDSMIRDIREAQREYDRELDRLMRKRYREGDVRGKVPDQDIVDKMGQRPGPVEPWVACKQGNRYALGFTQEVDERLRPFLPVELAQKLEEEELNFAESDGWSGVDEEAIRREREDTEALEKAWNAPKGVVPGGIAERQRNRAIETDGLDDMFDVDALGGKKIAPQSQKYTNHMKGKRPRDKKGRLMSAEQARQALIDTEND